MLAGSLGLSILLFTFGLSFFFIFLLIPLIPFLTQRNEGETEKRKTIKECPSCGWQTVGDEKYCPYCALPLTEKKI